MKKVTLVVLDREREAALKALRKTGVLHIEQSEAESEAIDELFETITLNDQILALLYENLDKKVTLNDPENREKAADLVERIAALRDEKDECTETVVRIGRELDRLSDWGDFDPADFDYFADRGLYFFPFEMSVKEYREMPDSIRTILVNQDKSDVRCLIWSEEDLLHVGIPQSAIEVSLPEKSTVELRTEMHAAQQRIPEIEREIIRLTADIPTIEAYQNELLAEYEFETVRAGMEKVCVAGEEQEHPADLATLTGYLPEDKQTVIRKESARNGWACLVSEPAEEDAVPTQLKNNRFVNLISPLMDFLGTVPGYREIDISLWFLLFFGIFFAMIFGDAGYGALLGVISLGGIISAKRKKAAPPPALYMLSYLAFMTVAWGVITCTWFGIPVEHLHPVFRSIALPAFSNANPGAAENIKIFCFTLGLLQISVAHIIGIVRYRKTLKALGELGSLMMTIGMYFVVLNLVVSAEKYPLSDIVLILIGAGFLLNFVFINFEGAIGKGILESLKNIITMCLGVVNMFGDIMSYIRLWAVGLAGAAISATVNEMAGPFLGGFIIFAGVLLLVFGHGLNYVMNALSVIVHGVRLNTLEFSNHLGLTWSGF